MRVVVHIKVQDGTSEFGAVIADSSVNRVLIIDTANYDVLTRAVGDAVADATTFISPALAAHADPSGADRVVTING